MAYVAAKGGEQAIQNAEALYRWLNGSFDSAVLLQIERCLPYLLDRLMGEGSLYAPELAALALTQTGGDLYEAVLLLRAYRSTQPRIAYAQPISPETTLVIRRISAAFKDIPGGQLLGPTLDYSHRVLNFDGRTPPGHPAQALEPSSPQPPKVADWLRSKGLMAAATTNDTPPQAIPDLTREPVVFPAPRAHRLQALSRADTGGILSLGYANMRGYGGIHPTVNEVRLAYAEVQLDHPSGAIFSAGRVRFCEAEVVSPFVSNQDRPELTLGYAATIGFNETKIIAAAMLDVAMSSPQPHPAHTEEFVLEHTEPVESSGFCIHYKLPHYVTFQSELDRVRGIRDGGFIAAGEVDHEA